MHSRLASVVLAMMLLGCARPVDRDAVVGTYTRDRDGAGDTLWVYADGRYARRVDVPRDARHWASCGTWQLDHGGRPETLTLSGPALQPLEDAARGEPPQVHWLLDVERPLIQPLRLWVSYDESAYFEPASAAVIGSGGER